MDPTDFPTGCCATSPAISSPVKCARRSRSVMVEGSERRAGAESLTPKSRRSWPAPDPTAWQLHSTRYYIESFTGSWTLERVGSLCRCLQGVRPRRLQHSRRQAGRAAPPDVIVRWMCAFLRDRRQRVKCCLTTAGSGNAACKVHISVHWRRPVQRVGWG